MALRLSTNTRNKANDAIVDELDAAATAGKVEFRTGAQPTNVDDADSGTLLGTCPFGDPAFDDSGADGGNAAGVATANAITSDSSADNSGTVGHARLKDGDDNIHSDCTCGQGSGDISFDNSTIVAGGTIAITSMTITTPIS